MLTSVLHQGATVMCMHGGQAQPTTPNPRVKIAGQAVVTQSTPYTVAGCPFTTARGSSPCFKAQWTSAATRVRVGGSPVLLQQNQAVCAPNGTGVNILVTQTRVRGT